MDNLKEYFIKCYKRYVELLKDSKIDKEMTAYYQGKYDFLVAMCQRFNIKGVCDNAD